MNIDDYKAFVFDLDGTLIDSKLDFDQMRADLGFPENVPILEYLENFSGEKKAELEKIIYDHELIGARRGIIMHGAQKFLTSLKSQGKKLGIITRNNRECTLISLSKLAVEFDAVISREDSAPKPNPKAFLEMCDSWDVCSDEALYMGDSVYDYQMAVNANCKFALYSPDNNKEELEAESDIVIRNFLDL